MTEPEDEIEEEEGQETTASAEETTVAGEQTPAEPTETPAADDALDVTGESEALPFTGISLAWLVALGLLLLAAGVAVRRSGLGRR